MTLNSIRFRFRQTIRASARSAYTWCTDFGPSDAALYGDGRTRTVRWLATDTLVMTDTTVKAGRRQSIVRLVRLSPETLSWTSTHLTGPYRYSQFCYRLVPEGPRRCHLEYVGLFLESTARPLSPGTLSRRVEDNRRADWAIWRQKFVPALERDLGRARPR